MDGKTFFHGIEVDMGALCEVFKLHVLNFL